MDYFVDFGLMCKLFLIGAILTGVTLDDDLPSLFVFQKTKAI